MTAQTADPPAFPATAPTSTPSSTPPPTPAPVSAAPPTWAMRWLGHVGAPSWSGEGLRLALALGFAMLFGVAVGLRQGGTSIALAALGAPAGIAAVAAVAVPAFAIVLSLANTPLEMMDLARATCRASMRAGLLLAGLAPGAALLLVSVEESSTVPIAAFGALALAGAVAARSFVSELRSPLAAAPRGTRVVLSVAMPAFLLFAAVLASRVWWLALPMLTETT